MPPVRVVIANSPAMMPNYFLSKLETKSCSLTTLDAPARLWDTIPRLRSDLAIVDLEVVSFTELAKLCHEFPATAFVCIHRLADDSIWAQSLAAGAVDCCLPADLPRILQNAERYVTLKHAEMISAA